LLNKLTPKKQNFLTVILYLFLYNRKITTTQEFVLSEAHLAKFSHLGSSGLENAWVHRIVHRAMAANRAIGADLATQSAAAIEAVHDVHPHLSAEDVLAAVYSEGWS
jgi:hypothetical protein